VTVPNAYELKGWQGEEIPLEAQKGREVEKLDDPEMQATRMVNMLSQFPFFTRVLAKLEASHPEFGDKSFRLSCGELFDETRDELEDMVVWMCIALWVMDGAEFAPGLLEMYKRHESDDDDAVDEEE
jgi:hypothetical protein